jgi:hypothetical protein
MVVPILTYGYEAYALGSFEKIRPGDPAGGILPGESSRGIPPGESSRGNPPGVLMTEHNTAASFKNSGII